jgi:phage-related protein
MKFAYPSAAAYFVRPTVTKFGDSVVVLHCWQKKTQTTSKSDKGLIVARYREAKEELS